MKSQSSFQSRCSFASKGENIPSSPSQWGLKASKNFPDFEASRAPRICPFAHKAQISLQFGIRYPNLIETKRSLEYFAKNENESVMYNEKPEILKPKVRESDTTVSVEVVQKPGHFSRKIGKCRRTKDRYEIEE
ncbi:hypothetical protein Tco_0623220 [Tanacetum coccineum]